MKSILCSTRNPAQRRFIRRMWATAGLCVLFSSVAALVFRYVHPGLLLGYPVAVLPALPILGALAATGIYLTEEKDEFQRDLLVQSLLGATGLTLALVTALGYLEDFAHIPHMRLVWVYPIFWLFVGISALVAMRRYK